MSIHSIKYIPVANVLDPINNTRKTRYQPYLEVLLTAPNSNFCKILCLVDSGADYNIFPYEYATAYLGMTDPQVMQGKKMEILTAGGFRAMSYGHKMHIQDPRFGFSTWVFFLKKQAPALLGRTGFFDKFKSVSFDETKRCLVLAS